MVFASALANETMSKETNRHQETAKKKRAKTAATNPQKNYYCLQQYSKNTLTSNFECFYYRIKAADSSELPRIK